MAGGGSGGAVVEGTLTMTERSDGRTEVQLAASKLELRGAEAPPADSVELPVQLVTEDGLLRAIAFPPEMPRAARAILTGIVTAFQHTDRPGDRWTAVEEDLLGRYLAEYRRDEAGAVVRSRARYTELRGARGLSPTGAGQLVPEERTELSFDGRGLVSAVVRIEHAYAVGEDARGVRLTLAARLEREADEVLAVLEPDELPAEPISDHLDHAALSRARAEAVAGRASTSELVADALRAARLDRTQHDRTQHDRTQHDRTQPGADKLRAASLSRLAARLRLDDGAAGELADAIRRASGDPRAVGPLAGALGSAGTTAATNALAGLLADGLPDGARSAILSHLALTTAPTSESVTALAAALDQGLGDEAALALGAEAHRLGEHPDGAAAVEILLERYRRAASHDDRRVYLQALANSGSPRALPAMEGALGSGNLELARLGAYGLRFLPGEEVDALLLELIRGGAPVILDAIRATAHRAPALWRPHLEAARAQYDGHGRVVDTIQAVLARLG
jgi:hypothetical protein